MEEWGEAAEQTLRALWGAPVACSVGKILREEGRSRVCRIALDGGPVDSVILKASVGFGQPYARADPTPDGPFHRLCKEWASGDLLGPLGLGPHVYAADFDRGFCLIEDLGDGETLADRLTGSDPQAATAGLMAYARSLADMHTATRGMEESWTALLARQGADQIAGGPLSAPWRLAQPVFAAFASELGFAPPGGLDDELAAMVDAIDRPRAAYLAFTPADCCPDNHFVRGERVIFFDCEGAGMRNVLLDASYLLAPFPTCWCRAALPERLPEQLLAAYRQGFACGDDFDDQLTMALAAWLAAALVMRVYANWLEADPPWGLTSGRQRVLAFTERLLARPNLAALAPGLADFTAEIDGRLRARWTDLAPTPLYPAFQ